MSEQSYRESHKGKGADYHETFSALRHRRLLWDLERDALRRIVGKYFMSEPPDHLDFACGTGRVLGFLAPYVRTSTGLDISENMLSEARKNAPGAQFHMGDITRESILADRLFGLITAFRFFPNAEESLREEVIAALFERLAPGGIVVFNNHMNKSSLLRVLLAIRGYRPSDGMSVEEVRALVGGAGLRVAATIPLGILPVGDNSIFGPYQVWRELDRAISAISPSERRAQDVIYICKRAT